MGQWQAWAMLGPGGRTFTAFGVEAGWRARDNQDWFGPLHPAPPQGHVVARALGVAEWAPQLGAINRSLAQGVRFFVRGRGWADYAKNDAGDYRLWWRGFFDSELFWNFSDQQRVFLRYEVGELPPDLTKHVTRLSIGVGAAF